MYFCPKVFFRIKRVDFYVIVIDVLLYLPVTPHSESKKNLSIKIDEKYLLCNIFYTKTKVKLLSADEKVATLKSSPGITIGPKNYEVAIEFDRLLISSRGGLIDPLFWLMNLKDYKILNGLKDKIATSDSF